MDLMALVLVFLLTVAALTLLHPAAAHLHLLDQPGGRKTHKIATPMIGGLAIYAALLIVAVFTPAVSGDHLTLLLISGLVVVVGVIDDVREMRASARILVQSMAAWLMIAFTGVKLESLGDLFGFGAIELGVLAVPVTIFATVGVINAVNMSDGLDGLAGGKALITLLFLCVVATSAGRVDALLFKQVLILALLAFLLINFRWVQRRPALAYLGDAGSTLVGFMLAWLLIENSQGENAIMAPTTALWLLAIPLMDTVALLVRRPLQGRSPFSPGRDHLHHMLMKQGLDRHTTVAVLYLAAIVAGCIGLLGHFLQAPESLMFLAFVLLFCTHLLFTHMGSRRLAQRPAAASRQQQRQGAQHQR